jgi:TolB protein
MKRIVWLLACWLAWPQAWAVLTIDITQGAEGALPIAVVPFAWQGTQPPEDVAGIVHNDLRGSGRFAPMPREHLPEQPAAGQTPNFDAWRASGMRHLVIGNLSNVAGTYTVNFELHDVLKGERVAGHGFSAQPGELRRVAHRISDMIYQALLGEPGAFNTRLAFVTVGGAGQSRAYRLQVADIDGANAQTILTSKEPLLSPAWSPDGESLAYVSLENKRSAIYVQDVRSGQRKQVAAYPGLNGAPAWSPDGTRLALSLSKDGNPEIYVLNLLGGNLQRLTSSPAIDTEPNWSPDGGQIAFTSDRGGGPQIYLMPASGGGAQRLTFEGRYNASPRFSADGKKLVMVHGDGNTFRIALLNLENRQLQILTNAGLDESPAFAPNGSMVIYASGRELAAVSTDGRIRQRLAVEVGEEVREPAWSPLLAR